MFTIVLLEPQIPPNTGSTGRLCGATNTRLHIVGNLGFELSDKTLKRAGLDYWDHIDWQYFPDLDKPYDPFYKLFAMEWISQLKLFHSFRINQLILVTAGTGVGKSTIIHF